MSSSSVHAVAAKGFEAQTQAYDLGRPTYPGPVVASAVEALALARDARVLELASGTGKLTAALLPALGPHVHLVAAEPAEEMRRSFAAKYPELELVAATADALPFGDASMDAIFVGQAFHWFANVASVTEMARVLKPGRALVLVWNLEDNTVRWIARLRHLYEAFEGDTPQFRLGLWRHVWRTPEAERLFEPLCEHTHTHVLHVTRAQIWARIVSKSYIAILSPAEQDALRAQVEAVLQEELGDKHENIPYPQITTIASAVRKSQ